MNDYNQKYLENAKNAFLQVLKVTDQINSSQIDNTFLRIESTFVCLYGNYVVGIFRNEVERRNQSQFRPGILKIMYSTLFMEQQVNVFMNTKYPALSNSHIFHLGCSKFLQSDVENGIKNGDFYHILILFLFMVKQRVITTMNAKTCCPYLFSIVLSQYSIIVPLLFIEW